MQIKSPFSTGKLSFWTIFSMWISKFAAKSLRITRADCICKKGQKCQRVNFLPSFYKPLFCTNAVQVAFMSLHFRFEFWAKEISIKLVKSRTVVNFSNILRSAFLPIPLHQKSTNPLLAQKRGSCHYCTIRLLLRRWWNWQLESMSPTFYD